MIICCNLSPLQKQLYYNYINSESIKRTVSDNKEAKASFSTLASITNLKKLCNHPDLVLDKIMEGADGFEDAKSILPPKPNERDVKPEHSGKLMLLDCLLANLKTNYDDKIVLVSNYTQTLDLFEKLCSKRLVFVSTRCSFVSKLLFFQRLLVRASGRFDDDQETRQSRREFQQSRRARVDLHAQLKSRRLRFESDRSQSPGDVRSRLESRQRRPGHGQSMEGWTKEVLLHLQISCGKNTI